MSPEPHGIVRALLRLQEEEGWLPPDRLEALAAELGVPLHRIESVSTFYTHFRRERPAGPIVEVCRDLSCRLAGGDAACERLRALARARGEGGEGGEGEPAFEVHEVSCLGRCDTAPAAALGDHVLDATDEDAVRAAVAADAQDAVPRPVRSWPAADPYAAGELAPFGVLRSVVEAGSKTDPIERLEGAGLRGMGGAGFPTGRKWSLVAAEAAPEKVVVCNADESEPGTFKDRELLHDVPHLVLEGMALAAFCVGASRGIVFIRHEYGAERLRLEAALEAARAAGGLGSDLFGSGFDFDVEIFVSPGGYILGEETALLECMEDRRGEPRNKPPFPGNAGLDGLPTLINNVETLVHAVSIVHRGVDWWRGLGLGDFVGHKFLSVSGDVAAPGVSLFPVGTSLGDVLEAHGGMKDGATLAAVAPGGASSNFLGPEALELALDFDALAAAGTMLGSGAAVFVDGSRDLLDVGRSITRFFRNESCGKCVPCRVGSEKAVALLSKGAGVSAEDEALVRSLHETMQQTSICGLGQVALGPLLSILDRFPEVARATDGD